MKPSICKRVQRKAAASCALFAALSGAAVICRAQVINTIAGNGMNFYYGDGGPATSASFVHPNGVAVDSAGNVYLVDPVDNVIRKVNKAGIISTVAGGGSPPFSGDGGPATSAGLSLFPAPRIGIAVDGAGNLYIADTGNQRVRKVDASGIISTVAGNGQPIFSGDGGPATSAGLRSPSAVAVDRAGNLYIADFLDARVRKLNTAGIITTVAGGGTSGDGGPATSASLYAPVSVAVDSAGNLYIGDETTSRIRKVDTAGIITTVAGNGSYGFSGDGGPAINAQIFTPLGLAVDGAGNLFIADRDNNRIRKVDASGIITTFAGTGVADFKGDGGPAASARIGDPADVAADASGNVYIADTINNRIREVTAAPPLTPAITLVANAFGDTPVIAPNSWVEIKGSNLAPSGDTRIWLGSDFVNNQMPTQLDGVSVTVNGKSAYVYYISPTQVDILTPPDTLPASVAVQLTNGGTKGNVMTVQAQQDASSFFVFDGTHVTATHLNGSLLAPTSLYPGFSTPAKPNETVILYANGFGPTTSPVVSGSSTQGGTLPVMPVIKIGGITASVTFAGLVSPGTFQFNVVVPASAPDGNNTLTATYNGLTTQPSVILAVQH